MADVDGVPQRRRDSKRVRQPSIGRVLDGFLEGAGEMTGAHMESGGIGTPSGDLVCGLSRRHRVQLIGGIWALEVIRLDG
ncbi:hypothetical protein [Candidatus Poriferisodalis sp.]|uniref:hypothetical protein n=1 Tax=Candidatus Poriferisodalis sp. TaxID=3101277 RepID=UPI003D0A7446